MIIRDLFQKTEGKDVLIQSKPYGSTAMIEFRGKVTSYCFGEGTEMFLELDNSELINTKYIVSIKINS